MIELHPWRFVTCVLRWSVIWSFNSHFEFIHLQSCIHGTVGYGLTTYRGHWLRIRLVLKMWAISSHDTIFEMRIIPDDKAADTWHRLIRSWSGRLWFCNIHYRSTVKLCTTEHEILSSIFVIIQICGCVGNNDKYTIYIYIFLCICGLFAKMNPSMVRIYFHINNMKRMENLEYTIQTLWNTDQLLRI